MNCRKLKWLGLIAGLALGPVAWGQVPAIPAAPAIPTAAPAAPSNLWSFLLPNATQKSACKTCFCNSAIGQLVSGAAGPISAMSGGLIQNRCALNSLANDLQMPAGSSQGAAAMVKKDEADAAARRQAVRYLGTVDCSRWPEAEGALLLSLRKDRNECVRWEAALALGNGCCCTNAIIDALENCVLGENKKDPFPPEKSERVRAAAAEALARCPLMQKPIKVPEKEKIKVDSRPNADPMEYYRRVAALPREKVQASARAVLVSLQRGGTPQTVSTGNETVTATAPAVRHRPAGLVGIVSNAFSPDAAITPPADSEQPRQPFFANLTKALTGKAEPLEIAAPSTTGVASSPSPFMDAPRMPRQPAEIKTAPGANPRPSNSITLPPRSTGFEVKAIPPANSPPVGIPASNRSERAKPAAPVETQPASPRTETSLGEPRESVGSVEIESPDANDTPRPANLPVPPRP